MTSRSPILIKNRLHVRRIILLYRFYFTYILHLATTLQDVRLDLAKEEAAEVARGRVSLHNVTLTTFLTTALDLEEQQYAIGNSFSFDVANPKSLGVTFDSMSRRSTDLKPASN